MDDLDMFFEPEFVSGDFVKLSHLNNKSSVLCPESQDITSQYLILQQLDAHQRMISRAKSTIDTSAPKSLQSYISVADQQRKKLWQKVISQSRESSMDDPNYNYGQPSSSRAQVLSDQEDNISLNASSMNKGVQTGIPFTTFNCITDDKISWYLDALSHGELPSQSYLYMDDFKYYSRQSAKTNSMYGSHGRIVKGDILDDHKNCFVKLKNNFSPRILASSNAKSKVKDMRCYNPPFRRKKNSSSHSSDTFESYENEDESDVEEREMQKSSDASSVDDETMMKRSLPSENNYNPSTSVPSPVFQHYRPQNCDPSYHAPFLNRNEEDKYLNFLSKVTEDILRSGVYSDKAVQQAFEFHMQFCEDETNKDELQSLLNQILDGLKISDDESSEMMCKRNAISANFSRPNTPPEKESPDALPTTSDFFRSELNLRSAENGTSGIHAMEQSNTEILTNSLQSQNNSNKYDLDNS